MLGTKTKSTNIRIHELVIFNQTTKIDTHEEKYFHGIQNYKLYLTIISLYSCSSKFTTVTISCLTMTLCTI